MVKTKCSSPETGIKARMSTLTSLTQYSTECYNQCNKANKGIKSMQIGKKKLKLFLFADVIIIYIEIPSNVQKVS